RPCSSSSAASGSQDQLSAIRHPLNRDPSPPPRSAARSACASPPLFPVDRLGKRPPPSCSIWLQPYSAPVAPSSPSSPLQFPAQPRSSSPLPSALPAPCRLHEYQ